MAIILIMTVIGDYELAVILVTVIMLKADLINRDYGLAVILIMVVIVLAGAELLNFGCINAQDQT